jgi:hypothetical protein
MVAKTKTVVLSKLSPNVGWESGMLVVDGESNKDWKWRRMMRGELEDTDQSHSFALSLNVRANTFDQS